LKAYKLKIGTPQSAEIENGGPHFAHPAHSLRPLLQSDILIFILTGTNFRVMHV